MAYEPKTWVCGETITAEALNHMEQGIASGGGTEPLILTSHTEEQGVQTCSVLDHTYREIKSAFEAGRLVLLSSDEGYAPVAQILSMTEGGQTAYVVAFQGLNTETFPYQMSTVILYTNDMDGYPTFCVSAG